MTQTLVALYDSFDQARKAVEELVQAGVSRDKISLVAHNTDNLYTNQIGGADGDVEAGEGASFGAVVGGLIGLGAAIIPGVGPVIAAGTIASALIGAGVGAAAGAVTGGLTASLVNFGVPEADATIYTEGVRRGGALVTAHVEDGMVGRAEVIMNRYAPANIDNRSEYYRKSGWKGYDPNADTWTGDQVLTERNKMRELGIQPRYDEARAARQAASGDPDITDIHVDPAVRRYTPLPPR